ncbi:MAG: hypothetical protein JWO63_2514 [Frankiales bacterium]|nr:hypothetical protein [Frankiales bacterium]
MIATESLHARPEPGKNFSPCCGRTLAQLPQYDRITFDPEQVTCGRLSATDALLLSGQPVVTDPNNEQLIYTMAVTVCGLSPDSTSLQQALDSVHAAMRQVLPREQAVTRWSAALMVQVTTRAQDLIRQ